MLNGRDALREPHGDRRTAQELDDAFTILECRIALIRRRLARDIAPPEWLEEQLAPMEGALMRLRRAMRRVAKDAAWPRDDV